MNTKRIQHGTVPADWHNRTREHRYRAAACSWPADKQPHFFPFISSIPSTSYYITFALLLQLPAFRNSGPGSHSGRSSLPPPLRCEMPSSLSRKELSIFSPRCPSLTRVELCEYILMECARARSSTNGVVESESCCARVVCTTRCIIPLVRTPKTSPPQRGVHVKKKKNLTSYFHPFSRPRQAFTKIKF